MKLVDGLFLESCREVAAKYPEIPYEEITVDNCCLQLVSKPEQFDVMVTPKLYKNLIANMITGLAGGIGVMPGEDFHWTLPDDSQELLLRQEQNERIWLDMVGGPSRYRETILSLKQQIAELSNDAKASKAREKQRDIQYEGMKTQFDILLTSKGIPPCPGDAVCPPRPPQSLPISHGVYGQHRDVTEEPSSDEYDEDYYVGNTLPRC
ncbi:Isocitrate dehydrogenase [NAD] regulatory subunit 1, mitochondrial [Capsicum baccatum]|uniref:Isocitrate dehydrogenase [NAD] regulatory subunit 1, mitochondrial n=1 Tax=Capsicum baccatum TaxID=33114 RepID=A0A2G2VZB9_CAPBA|nr:Isocitrate dehydrogenase [NAD] regulatory subunit 1, mitochondrial [Capsicum baccatum]